MDLSIIILNYRQKGLVKQCIKGIIQSRIKLKFEIIIVDNNSGDGCLEMARREFPAAITIDSKNNSGFASGNNLGIERACGKYVIILNPDIAVTENVLEKCFGFMEGNKNIGIIGPRLINPDGTIQFSCRKFPSWRMPICRRTILGNLPSCKVEMDRYLMKDFDHNENCSVDWLFGACLFIRREMLARVGAFDNRFFMYFEDLDLCRRFWQNGFEVWFFAEVEMVHYHQRLSAEKSGFLSIINSATRMHLISGIKYFIKYFNISEPNRK